MPPYGQADPSYIRRGIRGVAHRILKSVGVRKQVEIVGRDRSTGRQWLRTEGTVDIDEGDSDESAIGEAGRAAVGVGWSSGAA